MSGTKAGRPGQAFGRLLRQTRTAAGLSQDELAQRSGLSVRGISDMERGFTARPFNRSVRLLADAMMLTGDTREKFIRAAAGDAAGRAAPGGSARPPSLGSVVPQQLPAGLRNFAGRTRELTALGTTPALAEGAPDVVTISGTAGVGKTTLAVHFAHQAVAAFPDGQLYFNLRGFGRPRRRPPRPMSSATSSMRSGYRRARSRPARTRRLACTATCWPASGSW